MITSGTSNDVKIVVEDGEILANKDVLTARNDYFATMLSNRSNKEIKFVEGETSTVTFDYCSKAIMEKIIQYLFSGSMTLHDLSLPDLLKMMNMTNMMMVGDLRDDIQEYVLELIPDSGVNCGSIPELVESLILAEKFEMETIKEALKFELFRSLKDISHIPEVVQNSEAFKSLPVNLVKEIFLEAFDQEVSVIIENDENYDEDNDEDNDEDYNEDYNEESDEDTDEESDEEDEVKDSRMPTTKEGFDAFVFWLTENECSDEDKREIADSFDFSDFTGKELLTDVRRSGLYSIEKIDTRVLEILEKK